MIREIVNYTKHLKENSQQVFEDGLEPSKGLHIFVELDEEGNAINFPGEKGKDWDYYDGKEKSDFIKKIVPYDLSTSYITMNKQQRLDPKQKIHSASPFAIAFNFNFNDDDKKKYGILKSPNKKEKVKNDRLIKSKRVEVINDRIVDYFINAQKIFELDEENKILSNLLKSFLVEKLNKYIADNLRSFNEIGKYWKKLNEKEYVKLYLRNVTIEIYEKVYAPYLNDNIFNKAIYNIKTENKTYGAIDYYTTFADKKIFLKHKTGISKKGISFRFTGEDAQLLNLFNTIKKSKIFPNPLPLFIDKNEFRNTDEIISIFTENKKDKLSYSQILKRIFKENPNKVLENYYLLFFNGMVIEDFDFVSKFRYSLKENDKYPEIKNLYKLKKDGNLKQNIRVKNIFHFEADIVKTIFNGIVVGANKENYWVHYFNRIDSKSKDLFNKIMKATPEPMYSSVLKYRKAFYDYIYKSKTEAISCLMWDEIMWNSIIGDLRTDKITDKGYHSIEYSIKEKLNIWFSLYNYFTNNLNRKDMASKIPELLEKMKQVANDENAHFETTEEFAFGAGQVIYFLLDKSKASEKKHALLEPFIQKVKAEQLQSSIAQTVNMYKHEISFGHGRFERLSSEVLAFDTDENLKNYQRLLLAGYFATPVIYEKKEETN